MEFVGGMNAGKYPAIQICSLNTVTIIPSNVYISSGGLSVILTKFTTHLFFCYIICMDNCYWWKIATSQLFSFSIQANQLFVYTLAERYIKISLSRLGRYLLKVFRWRNERFLKYARKTNRRNLNVSSIRATFKDS